MSDSQGRGGNNDGVNPILRAETLVTLKAGKISRNGFGTADGSGGTTAAATATSTIKANEDILSDGSSEYNYNNNGAIDGSVIDLVDGEDDSDDDIRDKSCEIITIGSSKGKPPFHLLSGDVMRVMTDKVEGNYTDGNPNVSSADELKNMLGTVVEKRVFLLKLAGELDAKMEVANNPLVPQFAACLQQKSPTVLSSRWARPKYD